MVPICDPYANPIWDAHIGPYIKSHMGPLLVPYLLLTGEVFTFLSILFYPITLQDDFATIPFHFILFPAALIELAKSIPVHSLILSSHLLLCIPLLRVPFTVSCRTIFA